MIIKNKSFKTIIITKPIIILTACIIFLICVFLSLIIKKDNLIYNDMQFTSAKDFHNMIISEQLQQKTNAKSEISRLINAFLGFDLKNCETILFNASSQFHNIDEYAKADETVYPMPVKENNEPLITQKIDEQNISKGISINNATNLSVDINKLLSAPLSYTLSKKEPQILIVHTHTTESYTKTEKAKYTSSGDDRTTDDAHNMIAVGKELSNKLKEKGISVIHDTTVHDYPSYSGAYNRSKQTVLKNLRKYPSIKLVLDLHRDGIVKEDGTKVKVCCDIDGKKVAQCMLVIGSNVLLEHSLWEENLKLGLKLQNIACKRYPEFMRPINLREQRFNQQLSTGALIVEVGSNGNTLEEAKLAVGYLAEIIYELF